MKVLKFGGSSVSTPSRIKSILEILKTYQKGKEKFTVVFSAFGGITDLLIEMGKEAANGNEEYLQKLEQFKTRHISAYKKLLKGGSKHPAFKDLKDGFQKLENILQGVFLVREITPRTLDYIVSFGERNSAYFISCVLNQEGIKAQYLDARKVIRTDDNFGAAKINIKETYNLIQKYYSKNTQLQIVTGFVSSTEDGLTTTLGRGGSDFTASILAAALKASRIEIWTDVDGVLTADPRKVPKAFTIPSMTYAEAMEMSHFGAKVIYPPTLLPALQAKIPLYIKNTFRPGFEGTLVSEHNEISREAVKGISSISDAVLLTLQGSGLFGVPGSAARLFAALARKKINVILITQSSSEHAITFAVKPENSRLAKKCIEAEFKFEIRNKTIDPINIEKDYTVVAVIGENMRYSPGVAGKLFQAMGKNGINIIAIAQGSSELNISFVIKKDDERKALNAIHESFFLSYIKVLHLFIVGVGLIGSTLLKQIKKQAKRLKEEHSLEIRIVGLSNSRQMYFDTKGVSLSSWEKKLKESKLKMTMPAYIKKIKDLNLRNSIFIDNTANESIAKYYEQLLDASISISTPNKIATSSDYLSYLKLKQTAEKRGVKFLYETNVGAGLPVLSTLKDLISSGDKILKIEAVLSGSLSFIFNSFNGSNSFSNIVKEAQQNGYTEPDPRDDLSGRDVRRKLIILARESGYALEAKDVKIHGILNKACNEAKTVPLFFKALENADEHYESLRLDAAKKSKVLRFIGTLEKGKASISLKSVDSNHPFYSLSGSDNMIVFTTERYKARPLVIRGPGAGAEVTAAGVFAEIISIGSYLT